MSGENIIAAFSVTSIPTGVHLAIINSRKSKALLTNHRKAMCSTDLPGTWTQADHAPQFGF